MAQTHSAKPGWFEVDGQTVWLDSKSEAIFMRGLVKRGFSRKWRRPKGVKYNGNPYTPDFELSVNWHGKEVRAHVEYKSTSASQFKIIDRNRALAALHYYGQNPLVLLYVGKTQRWYYIDSESKYAKICPPPVPGTHPITVYPPASGVITTTNKYGRKYKNDIKALIGTKIADGLEATVRLFFGTPKDRKKRRR